MCAWLPFPCDVYSVSRGNETTAILVTRWHVGRAEGHCVLRFGNGTETKEISRENWS